MSLRFLVFFALAAAFARADELPGWTPLLDEKLSQWEVYLGVPDPSVEIPNEGQNAGRAAGTPLGLNNDPKHVFSTRQEDGETLLHISGEIFGGLTTLKSFSNYHLRAQFRWGSVKWPPRLNAPRDNGILYHCIGEHGAFWKVWKRSLEYQVQENDIGDFFPIAGTIADIPAAEVQKDLWRYQPGAPLRPYSTRCARGLDYTEKPNGEWNTLEILTVGTRAIHLLNGKVVNVLTHTRYKQGDAEIPLSGGQLQIQSEAAEADYRRIEIRPISEFPAEYRSALPADEAK
jgi:hypothetical protein